MDKTNTGHLCGSLYRESGSWTVAVEILDVHYFDQQDWFVFARKYSHSSEWKNFPLKRHFFFSDFGGEDGVAKQAALDFQQQVTNLFGANINNHWNTNANGDIEMDIDYAGVATFIGPVNRVPDPPDYGFFTRKMLVSPESIDKMLPHLWCRREHNGRFDIVALIEGKIITAPSFIMGPVPDGFVIDHKNGDTTDNRLQNLRIATYKTNAENRGIHKPHSSGVPGVTVVRNSKKEPAGYQASWVENTKSRSARFMTKTHGSEKKALEAAIAHRYAMEDKHDIQSRRRTLLSMQETSTDTLDDNERLVKRARVE
jgi:hypothetical protein